MHKIGSLKLSGEVFLAPMADYTNVAFRTMAKEYGAALVYTELISAKALTMKSKRTEGMLKVNEGEKPVFLQLFGETPENFGKAISIVEKKYPNNFAGYDLNCGCAVPKAQKGKYGCMLMEDSLNVGQILRVMKASTSKPVTVKMRLGLKKENFLEVAKEAVAAEVDAITLHARLGEQGYSGNANWEKIFELKNEFDVPIIGNGDIKNPQDILAMKKMTSCDFEMVGRATIGNAFFFKQAKALLNGKEIPLRTINEIKKEGTRYFELAKEFELGPNDLRPYFIGLSKGLAGAPALRNKFGLSKSVLEMKEIFEEYFK
ncbi:MAG: tRNA-dihydrouridine synthase family protein [archaeon]|jgi:nifR3 family TIM-barrel protein